MWDVIWTDPDRELVGEHRARKGNKKGARSDASSIDNQHASSRSSLSTQSSVSSSDAGLSFLRSTKGSLNKTSNGRGREKEGRNEGKRSWRSTSWSKASSTASSAIASLSIPSARSPLSPTFDIRSRRSSGLATTNESSLHSRPSIASRVAKDVDDGERGANSSQPGPYSQTTTDLDENVYRVESDQQTLETSQRPDSGEGREADRLGPPQNMSKSSSTESPALENQDSEASPTIAMISSQFPSPKLSLPPAVPPKSPLRPSTQSYSFLKLPENPEDWLPPSEWTQCPASHHLPKLPAFRDDSSVLDAGTVKEEIEQMRTTAPDQLLARLQNLCRDDVTVKRELEKKRWLLSALQSLDRRPSPPMPEDDSNEGATPSLRSLILFDSQNYVAYLAALHPESSFYHVSRQPLRNATFANVIPITLSSLSAATLSSALPTQLDHIYTLSLPSLCPAPDLVPTLACLRSRLKPQGGRLNLTLIDAMPHPATLGANLRSWFEKNLIVHLPPHSLSHTPTCLFPKCLGAACLRGPGSKRVKTKFFASPESIRGGVISEEEQQHEDHDPDPAIRKLRSELRVKAELRCLVGRMLWMEVWGTHISPRVGKRSAGGDDEDVVPWWWDDEACMTECLQLGTFWEYHTIEAVRGP